MINILNLTQHVATPEQQAQGVVDLQPDTRDYLVELLTVDELPSQEELLKRCAKIAALAEENCPESEEDDGGWTHHVMVGGAPWMMSALEGALYSKGIRPRYAFSKRESIEVAQPDGTVRKTMVFRHAGWVPAL